MLSSIIFIAITLQVALVSGFLLKCPIDRAQRVDNEAVMGVFETFYRDLADAQAMIGSQQVRPAHRILNEQDKKNGLNTLKVILRFNYEVDRLYGIKKSPDFRRLPSVHSSTKDWIEPLNEIDGAMPIAALVVDIPEGDVHRVGETFHVFARPTVSEASVEDILCEFAQKMSILGVSLPANHQVSLPDYLGVLEQARQINATFAEELKADVVDKVDADIEQAYKNADHWCIALEQDLRSHNSRESFAQYFGVELRRRSEGACGDLNMFYMDSGITGIKYIREKISGLSLGKILELEGKVAFQRMTCFHKHLGSAYNYWTQIHPPIGNNKER